MSDDPDLGALRAAYQSLAQNARAGEDCPLPERIWLAAAGALSASDRRDVIGHTASCAACAEAWRLAAEIHPEPVEVAPPWWTRAWAWPAPMRLAAAAMVLAAVGGLVILRGLDEAAPPGYRDAGPAAIQSRLPEGRPLPRAAFRLLWSPPAEGSRYEVRVTTEALDPVASARDLEEPSFLVPEAALRSLPSGERLLWQVEARLPDGVLRTSPTFSAVIE